MAEGSVTEDAQQSVLHGVEDLVSKVRKQCRNIFFRMRERRQIEDEAGIGRDRQPIPPDTAGYVCCPARECLTVLHDTFPAPASPPFIPDFHPLVAETINGALLKPCLPYEILQSSLQISQS